MPEKNSITGTQRVKLLMNFSKMNLSDASQKTIAHHIGSLEKAEREQRAKEINKLIEQGTTETELMKTLNL